MSAKCSKKRIVYGKQNPNKRNKKVFFALLFFVIVAFCFLPKFTSIIAGADDGTNYEQDILESVNKQLNELDFDGLDKILQEFSESQKSIFGASNFVEKMHELLSSEQGLDFGSLFSSILSIVFEELIKIVPILASVCGVAVLGNLVSNLRTKSNEKSIGDLIHFVCYGIIIVLVTGTIVAFVNMAKNVLGSIQTQMQITFPILLTLMTASGGVASAGIYQPAMAILSSFIMEAFIWVVFPLFIFNFVFNIVGNLSDSVKLDKFCNFFSSAFKWTAGIIFTLFTTFMAIQGISAGSYDGFSVKSAKYAIKSYIPFVGGYISDGFNLIVSSSVLIKNALGVAGLLLLITTILVPILQIIIFGLGLKLVSAIIEPLSDKRISNFVFNVGKSTNYLVATICSVSFMYLITIALVMCTGNLIV